MNDRVNDIILWQPIDRVTLDIGKNDYYVILVLSI